MKRTIRKIIYLWYWLQNTKRGWVPTPTIWFQYIKGYAHTCVYKLLVEDM